MMPDIGDMVEIVADIPQKKLWTGDRGIIVNRHGNDVYEIEFTDENGETIDFTALHAKQFILVWRAENRQWIPIAEQTSALVAGLSEEAAKQVLDFARFLFVQTHQSADASA